jgi:gamma-glutamyltranspeptidase / glutathione hydrolase
MKKIQLLFLVFLGFHFHLIAQLNAYKYVTQKNIEVKNAAVVSAHALASDAGMQVMKQGGNAFDAAIATQFALAVVYPNAGNLGGGGFMVAHTAQGKNIAMDYRETAPAKASRDMYLDTAGNPITILSMQGHLACGTPGSVAGILATLKYAKLPLSKLIARAIMLAEKGFALSANQAASLNSVKDVFLKVNKNKTAFTKNVPWKEGDILIQTDLANTLKRIRDNGAKGFYEGETAKFIATAMQNGYGIISLTDLKNYKVKPREIMQFKYKDADVLTMPLPSSGGIIIQQLLKIMEQQNLSQYPFQSAEGVQLMVEAERIAFEDRAEFLGDPDFVNVPIQKLVSDEYLKDRMKNFVSGVPGNIKSNNGPQDAKTSEQTTHISIIDAEGNAVSVTTTLNDNYGSKTVIDGAGFIMNNEMDDFSVKPGVPNMYGAIGNDKNAIAPGKTMLSSMTPTIVLKNGRPIIVVGTPGGTTIPTSVFQSLVNEMEYKLSANDVVNKPKFHHQALPDVIFVEKDYPMETRDKLTAMGYNIVERGSIGKTEMIKIVETIVELGPTTPTSKTHNAKITKKITAVADKRGDDDARGF